MILSSLFRALALALGLALSASVAVRAAKIPDVELRDQNGHAVNFHRDLVQGRVVAVNFIFTSCTTICPQLGAASAALAQKLAAEGRTDFRVISISIDPETDTPERLRAWSENFGPAPGWTLLTGPRREIETLLKALQAYTPDINLHSSAFLLGNEATGAWKRVSGSAPSATLAEALRALAEDKTPVAASPLPEPAPGSAAEPLSAAGRYFPDVPLVDQDGKTLRFYSDLLKGRIVVINTIFSDCGGVCPIMTERFAEVQTKLGDRVGRDVTLISITVDPATDTPEKLSSYAKHVGARPGWHFLTGDKANIDTVLKRLGQYVENREAHSNILIIGNEPTGLWKKAFGLAPPEQVLEIVESVLADRG